MGPLSAIASALLILVYARPSDSVPTPSLVSQSNDTTSAYHCITLPDWLAQSFDTDDCPMAISQFFVEEKLKHGNTLYEFLSRGVDPRTGYPKQNVPRKYSYGESSFGIQICIATTASFA